MTSGPPPSKAVGAKGKAKATRASEGIEILSSAKLRLKAGQRYALIGRNGSGKSTLLKAIAQKLIPGIPEQTRIAILQQTDAGDADADVFPENDSAASVQGRTVLQEVIEQATSRDALEKEIAVLGDGVNSADGIRAVRALRTVRHERMQRRLFLLDKMARLRSGARGFAARKELVAFEKEVAASAAL